MHEAAGAMEVVSAPFHIRGADIAVRGPAPVAGQHTEEVFVEAGLSLERIEELVTKSVLR